MQAIRPEIFTTDLLPRSTQPNKLDALLRRLFDAHTALEAELKQEFAQDNNLSTGSLQIHKLLLLNQRIADICAEIRQVLSANPYTYFS